MAIIGNNCSVIMQNTQIIFQFGAHVAVKEIAH